MNYSRPLFIERAALRHLLTRLMTEEVSLDDLCKHVPRVVSVAANVARIQSVLEQAASNGGSDELMRLLAELGDDLDNEASAALN